LPALEAKRADGPGQSETAFASESISGSAPFSKENQLLEADPELQVQNIE
jgi:hypothetical protein